MYPSDDIAVTLGLGAVRARALREDIAAQIARIRTLYDRAESVDSAPRPRAELLREVRHTVRISRELVASAREHGRRSEALVQHARDRRLMRAGGEP